METVGIRYEKVLLTGATGFIGSQVTAELLRRGYEVHALVYPAPVAEQPNFIQHTMNLMDKAAVSRFWQSIGLKI